MYKMILSMLILLIVHGSYSISHHAFIPNEIRAYILKQACLQELRNCSTIEKKKDISRIVDNTLRALRCQPIKQDMRDLLVVMMTALSWSAKKKRRFLSDEFNKQYGRNYYYTYQKLFPCTFAQWWSNADAQEKNRYRTFYSYGIQSNLLVTVPAEITSFQGIGLLVKSSGRICRWYIFNEYVRVIDTDDFSDIEHVGRLVFQGPMDRVCKNAFRDSEIAFIELHLNENAEVDTNAFKSSTCSDDGRPIDLVIHGKDEETMQKKWCNVSFHKVNILHIWYCADSV